VSDRKAIVERAVAFLSAGFRAPVGIQNAVEKN